MIDPVIVRPSDLTALDTLEVAAFDVRDLCETLINEVSALDGGDDAADEACAMLIRFQELCQEIADTVGDVREVCDA
jgi:3-deoxy-D-manno-octulosonate 8-phosphate phosphatase KdsC-like HAD superfamily phosphatase